MSIERIKRLILMPFIGLIFALSSLFTPVYTTYAVPDTTTEVAPEEVPETPEEDPEAPKENQEVTTEESQEGITEGNQEGTTEESPAEERSEKPAKEPTDAEASCAEQIGDISWIVCPATGFLANIIDALYNAIEGLLVIEPLSSNTDSPIFIVWNYARNISNIIFVILLLVVIYSQVTGLGISNYGIKRTLPRIIVAAILVNLSFFFASLVVDISNIIGTSLRDLLTNIGESAIASGAVSPEISFDINIADVFAAIITGGTIFGVSLAFAGGFSALLASIIPVIVGGVVAVAAGLITISLRQAVVSLLVMISPLAFVAYLLPNTEKWYRKWFQLFMQMIFFYPMFSLLFGASRLAGWVLMTSTDNGWGIILGVAVQIFPLFFGISLMKMSGTILGNVNSFFNGLGSHATNASRNWANEIRARRRAAYFANKPRKFDIPRRAAQTLNDRRIRRARETAELQKRIEARGEAYTARTYFRRDGQVSRRGRQHADNVNKSMQYQEAVLRADNNFDEGLAQFSKPGSSIYKKAEALDNAAIRASDRLKREQARSADINLENLKGYHQRINEAITANANKQNGQSYDKSSYARYQELLRVTGNRGENGVNTIFANALAQKARADREIKGDYELLLQEAAYTANIDDMLGAAILTKDPNIMAASIETMMQRGDTDLIGDKLEELTAEIAGDTPEALAMQKRLSDTMVGYKGDSAILWGYAKCLNMARGRAEAARRKNRKIEAANQQAIQAGRPQDVKPLVEVLPDFFTFEDYLKSDGEAAKWGLDVHTMIGTADESIGGTQDRTAWSFSKEHGELYFTETQRRNALFGGVQVTGEKLLSLIDMHLGKHSSWNYEENGQSVSSKSNRKVLTFDNAEALETAQKNIRAMIAGNNAGHFTKFKSDILSAFGAVMSVDPSELQDASSPVTIDLRQDKDAKVRAGLERMATEGVIDRDKISADLHRLAGRGALNNMNTATRAMLNSVLHFDD